MSNIIEFVPRDQLLLGQSQPSSLSTTDRDAEVRQMLAREVEKLMAAMNFLEALSAKLRKEVASE